MILPGALHIVLFSIRLHMETRVLSLPLKHFQQNLEDWKMNSYDEAEIVVKFFYKVVRISENTAYGVWS